MRFKVGWRVASPPDQKPSPNNSGCCCPGGPVSFAHNRRRMEYRKSYLIESNKRKQSAKRERRAKFPAGREIIWYRVSDVDPVIDRWHSTKGEGQTSQQIQL